MSYVVAYASEKRRVVAYLPKTYGTRDEAQGVIADMLSIYPASSPWHAYLFVAAECDVGSRLPRKPRVREALREVRASIAARH